MLKKSNPPPRKIALRNLPMRVPWMQTVVLYLFLDKLHAPGWIWGAVGLLLVIVWAIYLWSLIIDVPVDVVAATDPLYTSEE